MLNLTSSDWLAVSLALLGGVIGWLIAWWYARDAAREAQEHHLEQLEQMRRHHQQEMDLLRQQGQDQMTHLKTVLHRMEVPGGMARDNRGVPTGRPLTQGTIAATLGGVECQMVGETTSPKDRTAG